MSCSFCWRCNIYIYWCLFSMFKNGSSVRLTVHLVQLAFSKVTNEWVFFSFLNIVFKPPATASLCLWEVPAIPPSPSVHLCSASAEMWTPWTLLVFAQSCQSAKPLWDIALETSDRLMVHLARLINSYVEVQKASSNVGKGLFPWRWDLR